MPEKKPRECSGKIGASVISEAAPLPKRPMRKDPNDPNERAYLDALARDRREDLEKTLLELDKECSNSSSTPIT